MPTIKEYLSATLWGGAVADAIGNPLEFKTEVTDVDFRTAYSAKSLRISDDTQMTLFLYEGLSRGSDPKDYLLRWYQTQVAQKPRRKADKEGLSKFTSLHYAEAPGATCIGSCNALARGQKVDNFSKGNGTVMRAAPFAMHASYHGMSDEAAYMMAKDDAWMTHKHHYAWQSSVILTAIYLRIMRGMPFQTAVLDAVKALPSCTEVGNLVSSMVFKPLYLDLKSKRCGWVAEEALALAVGANLHHKGYLQVVRAACQGVACDSDTVAGIAGGLCAALGEEVPDYLKAKVAASDAIEYIISLYP